MAVPYIEAGKTYRRGRLRVTAVEPVPKKSDPTGEAWWFVDADRKNHALRAKDVSYLRYGATPSRKENGVTKTATKPRAKAAAKKEGPNRRDVVRSIWLDDRNGVDVIVITDTQTEKTSYAVRDGGELKLRATRPKDLTDAATKIVSFPVEGKDLVLGTNLKAFDNHEYQVTRGKGGKLTLTAFEWEQAS